MPGPIYHVNATALCPHGGQVMVVPATPRTLASTQPVATLAGTYPIVGCPFYRGDTYHPCVRVQWTVPAVRVTVMASPVILQTSTGLCLAADGTPQGPPIIAATQPRAVAT